MQYLFLFGGLFLGAVFASIPGRLYKSRLRRVEWRLDALLTHLNIQARTAVPGDVRFLAESGKKMEAIKLYREKTKSGLKEAHDAIQGKIDLDAKVSLLLRHFEVNATGTVPSDVKELVQQGRRIEAVKRIRESMGLGLKEAKDIVDSL